MRVVLCVSCKYCVYICCMVFVYCVVDVFLYSGVFFFKQKTAYEMLRSLVGSEMCIRDRLIASGSSNYATGADPYHWNATILGGLKGYIDYIAVSYTHLTLPTIYSV